MDTVELLTKFSDPEVIQSLSSSQRLMAGLITTVLGMGITFTALLVLQIITSLFEKIAPSRIAAQQPMPKIEPEPEQAKGQNDEELVAAITVALAVQLQTAASNIVIKNIRKLEDHSPTWNKVGLAEQMNNNS